MHVVSQKLHVPNQYSISETVYSVFIDKPFDDAYWAGLAARDSVCRFPNDESIPQINFFTFNEIIYGRNAGYTFEQPQLLGPTMIGFTAFLCFLPLPIGWWHCVRAINPILRTCYKCTAAEARHSLQDISGLQYFFQEISELVFLREMLNSVLFSMIALLRLEFSIEQ